MDYISANKYELQIEKIFSSDLPRAVETAIPIANVLNLKLELKPEFRETNNGVFAGMPHEIANEKYPGLFWNSLEWDEPYPQGESPKMFYERIKTAWENFTANVVRDKKNIILITHGGVINIINTLIDGTVYSNKTVFARVPNAELIPLEYINSKWQR